MRRFKFDDVVVGVVAIAALVLAVRNHNLRAIPEAQTRREQAAAHFFVVRATALPEVNQAVATLAAARQKLVTPQSVLASARQQELRIRWQYDRGDLVLTNPRSLSGRGRPQP